MFTREVRPIDRTDLAMALTRVADRLMIMDLQSALRATAQELLAQDQLVPTLNFVGLHADAITPPTTPPTPKTEAQE